MKGDADILSKQVSKQVRITGLVNFSSAQVYGGSAKYCGEKFTQALWRRPLELGFFIWRRL
jgi:hypothetical protein